MKPEFTQFSPEHGWGVALTLIPGLLLIIWGRKTRDRRVDLWLRGIIAGLLVFFFFAMRISRMIDGSWSIQKDLPLHLCGFSSALIPVMLFNRNFTLYETLYFWGLGGATQSLLTPNLKDPFPSFYYWEFFITHSFIIIGVLYATFVFHYRPTLRGLWRTYGLTFLLLFPIGLVNWILGSNYFFIAHKPETASLLDIMGPWPLYLIPLSLVALVIFFLCYLPFPIAERVRRTASESPAP
ncbi:MAG: TIGR02206 family membrane protein [Candidatus Neomarinimicrobiota bacterium]|nr:MAG: TIGR02206 family membrane protein [Candidatus Neomarinimicrobiota bacterium]